MHGSTLIFNSFPLTQGHGITYFSAFAVLGDAARKWSSPRAVIRNFQPMVSLSRITGFRATLFVIAFTINHYNTLIEKCQVFFVTKRLSFLSEIRQTKRSRGLIFLFVANACDNKDNNCNNIGEHIEQCGTASA